MAIVQHYILLEKLLNQRSLLQLPASSDGLDPKSSIHEEGSGEEWSGFMRCVSAVKKDMGK